MHAACLFYLHRLKERYPRLFRGKILEIGSMDMNGSPRGLFDSEEYIGLDWREGPGVDAVGLVHEWSGRPYRHFDTVLTTETLEHDPYWRETLVAAASFVKPGGSLIVTCAGPGRPPHCVDTSPGAGYYENRTCEEIIATVALKCRFRSGEWEQEGAPVFDSRALFVHREG